MNWLKKIIYAPFMYWIYFRMRGITYIELIAWIVFGISIGLMF